MKRAQDGAMEKAMLARKQHLEEMRDKIRAKVGSPSQPQTVYITTFLGNTGYNIIICIF